MTLPGIGPVLAGRIVEDRTANGPYRQAADLLRVKGIGPATLARLRPRLSLP
jgi:competence protein ComEA